MLFVLHELYEFLYTEVRYGTIYDSEKWFIQKNDFLSHDCTGYFHLYYVGYGQPGNPDYLNTLKNIFVSTHPDMLRAASRQAAALMIQDIPQAMEGKTESDALKTMSKDVFLQQICE